MGKNRLLIVFTGVIIQLLLASCTYDYFKDETNYQVYVPEVVDNKVSDCRVLVYDETGVLVGARYEAAPWKDPRMRAGLFSFRLPLVNIRSIVIRIQIVFHSQMSNNWKPLLLC